MDYALYKSYLLTEEELFFLLALNNVKHFYGLNPQRQYDFATLEEAHRVMLQLYQKKVIDFVDDDHARVLEPFKTIMRILSQASCCFNTYKGSDLLRARIVYCFENKAVFLEKSPYDVLTYTITLLPIADMMRVFEEEDYFFDKIQDIDLRFNEDLQVVSDMMTFMDIAVLENIVSVFEHIDLKTGNVTTRLIIEDQGLNGAVYMQSLIGSNVMAYDHDSFVDLIEQWIKE